MRRVPEVIDCWYDSGAMPFAQWGYPQCRRQRRTFQVAVPRRFHQRSDRPNPRLVLQPARDQHDAVWQGAQARVDAGSESDNPHSAIARIALPPSLPQLHRPRPDARRGRAEDVEEQAELPRAERDLRQVRGRCAAVVLLRQPAAVDTIRYSEQAIKDSIPEFLLRLWNVYSFFVIYANIDGFDPATEVAGVRGQGSGDLDSRSHLQLAQVVSAREGAQRARSLDLSELNRTVAAVVERMDAYDNFGACSSITEFVDALSNWYVRRSRDRFWAADKRAVEKLDAYWTLYECLVTTAKLVAPFVPFVAETMWQNLARRASCREHERSAARSKACTCATIRPAMRRRSTKRSRSG